MRETTRRIGVVAAMLVGLLAAVPAAAMGGTVQGRISDYRNGSGIQGISVTVYQRNVPDTTWVIAGSGSTNATGGYSIPGVSSNPSRVEFFDLAGRYAQRGWRTGYYYWHSTAQTLTVPAGTVTADATMAPAAHLRVRVVTEATGAPIPNIMADVQDVSANAGLGGLTDASGWSTQHYRADLFRAYGFQSPETTFKSVPTRPWTNDYGDADVHLSEGATTTITIRMRHLPTFYNDVVRLSGATRYETAVQLAKEQYPANVFGSWPGVTDVIVASGEDASLVDALSASGLAGAYNAPLLLVAKNSIPAIVSSAIGVMPDGIHVHIVGGSPAVSNEVRDQLADIPTVATVDRCSGPTRYETAAMVARWMTARLGVPLGTALLANGANPANFYDALALAPLSYAKHYPILLVAKDSVPATTSAVMTALSLNTRYLAGGPAAVSEAVRVSLAVSPTNRLFGSTRYSTAIAIAGKARSAGWLGYTQTGIAANLPDALAAGPMLGRKASCLLLTAPGANTLNAETNGLVGNAGFKSEFQTGFFCGGANVIPEAPRLAFMAAMN